MRSRDLVAPVLFLVASGCIDAFFGHCPPQSSAEWVEPGLHAQMPTIASRLGGSIEEEAAPPGLPFSDAGLAARWPGASLANVGWASSPELTRTMLVLDLIPRAYDSGKPSISMTAGTQYSEAELRAAFRSFAENTAQASPATVDAWTEELLGSKADAVVTFQGDRPIVAAYGYRVNVSGSFRLKLLYDDLGGWDDAQRERVHVSSTRLRWDLWNFRFELPVRELEARVGGEPFLPRVGVDDLVRVPIPDRWTQNESGAQSWLRDAFAELGRAEPAFESWEFSTVVC